MENLLSEFSTGLFIWQSIIFIALILILKKFAWKPILDAVKSREDSIETAIRTAQKAREDMKALTADNKKAQDEARIEREGILKEARDIRDSIINEAKENALTEAEKVTEAAMAQIENEKLSAMHEIKNQVAELSLEIAAKVLGAELKNEKAQKELIESSIKDLNLN